MNSVAYIVSNSGTINIVLDGMSKNIPASHPYYKNIVESLKKKDYSGLRDWIDIPTSIATKSNGEMTVKNGDVYHQGDVVHNSITKRMQELIKQKLPYSFLTAFLCNLKKNPSKSAIDELYLFLEHNSLPITDDGCFLAYKRVRNDFKDIHSGTIDNSIGKTPKIKRALCDTNRNNTCSSGLHFCSIDYLPHFGEDHNQNNRTVIVKINPRDVTSIPADYNNAKGRCCQYKVIAEHKDGSKRPAFKKMAASKSNPKCRLRDANGRFITWTEFRPRDKQGRYQKKEGYRMRDKNGRFIKKV